MGEVLGRAFSPPPSSDLTGTFSQGEGFPSHFETVDSATSGRDALRAEGHAGSNGIRFSGVSDRMVIL